jgi:hypothetical protein
MSFFRRPGLRTTNIPGWFLALGTKCGRRASKCSALDHSLGPTESCLDNSGSAQPAKSSARAFPGPVLGALLQPGRNPRGVDLKETAS